jgi:hypothetical protein
MVSNGKIEDVMRLLYRNVLSILMPAKTAPAAPQSASDSAVSGSPVRRCRSSAASPESAVWGCAVPAAA